MRQGDGRRPRRRMSLFVVVWNNLNIKEIEELRGWFSLSHQRERAKVDGSPVCPEG